MPAALDDIGERRDLLQQVLDELGAELAQLAGDRPAAPSREETHA